jgi:hypothetical protein
VAQKYSNSGSLSAIWPRRTFSPFSFSKTIAIGFFTSEFAAVGAEKVKNSMQIRMNMDILSLEVLGNIIWALFSVITVREYR